MNFVSPDTCHQDYKKRRSAFLKHLIASTPNVSLGAKEFRRWIVENSPHMTMTKPKSWADLARSLEADWPASPQPTITDLIGEARAADWDFTDWCYASGYDARDPDARRMFDCLLAYARREGGAGLN